MPSRRASSSSPPADSSSAGPATPAADGPGQRVRVLMPLPLDRPFDYLAGPEIRLDPGDFVRVPLGHREVTGCVWAVVPEDGGNDGGNDGVKLRRILSRIEAPPLPGALRRFIDWVAAYTCAPPGAVLRMAMSAPGALDPRQPVTAYVLEDGKDIAGLRMTAARRRVLDAAGRGAPLSAAELARAAGVGPGVVRGLAGAGILRQVIQPPPPPCLPPDPRAAGPKLSPAQGRAADALAASAGTSGFSVTLLDGVTGSGKTEVYFEAVAAALEAERQVLVLVPEIALTSQWLERFRRRFGVPPAQWHSDLSRARRRETWRAVADGTARVVVGARSALFLPFPRLGLIIVDEEHDAAFKQEEGVVYHARDMAVVRGRETGVSVVLVSATPSLETTVNVDSGRYERLHLPDRHGGAVLPEISVIDMRRDGPDRGSWLSPVLRAGIAAALGAGEQAMLFLNRRGYAPLTLCRKCGHRFQCPRCTAWLVEHRAAAAGGGSRGGERTRGRLFCHHCGFNIPPPDCCPECGAEETLAACGPGVERLAEEVGSLFPDSRTAIMASDMISGPEAAAELIRRIGDHEIDIVIGTQIAAKGHHFPDLTLVGVVDADLGLSGGDLRAAERTYQLLHQVAGRAGREARPGRVFLQTYMPEHAVMRALTSGDRDRFLEAEADARRALGLPPFGRLAALVVSGRNGSRVAAAARAFARAAPRAPGVEVLGPAPAPLTVLHGRTRWRFLVKAGRRANLPALMKTWREAVKTPGDLRVRVDIDPYSFL